MKQKSIAAVLSGVTTSLVHSPNHLNHIQILLLLNGKIINLDVIFRLKREEEI